MKLSRKYEYRRNLPHIQKADRAHYVTFATHQRWHLPPAARDLVLQHCLHDNDKKLRVWAVVVMPDHVHMIFCPLRDAQGEVFTFAEILNGIKGASAHSVDNVLGRTGTVWQDESFDHVLRSEESLEARVEYIRQNPVRRGLVKDPSEYRWLWCG